MGGLIHQHAAAFAFPGATPPRTLIIGDSAQPRLNLGYPLNFAQAATCNQCARCHHFGAKALLKVDGQQPLITRCRFDHRIGFGHLDGHWFFH